MLLKSRIGYFWLAIREDEEAARATGINTFRYKMAAVVISAGMTAFAGVFYAFYYNNLFPEQVFHISRSIELIVGADHRRARHAARADRRRLPADRPVETLTPLLGVIGVDLPGARQVLYGICLLFVIVALPGGVWPWLARGSGSGRPK